MSLSKVTGLYERNLQKSQVSVEKLEGNYKRPGFLEKDWKEIAKALASWQKAGGKWQERRVPGKKLEGNYKRAGFLEESWKDIAKEPAS
jgi:hypothetical protein